MLLNFNRQILEILEQLNNALRLSQLKAKIINKKTAEMSL